MYIPEVKEIIHRESLKGEFFTVVWSDDVQTTVRLAEGDESDEYLAFLYALGKRLFKDKGRARQFIRARKQVFENRVAKKIEEKRRLNKANNSGLVSKTVFRRNR